MVQLHLRYTQLLRLRELIIEPWVVQYYLGEFTTTVITIQEMVQAIVSAIAIVE